jgi:hypothetical protein
VALLWQRLLDPPLLLLPLLSARIRPRLITAWYIHHHFFARVVDTLIAGIFLLVVVIVVRTTLLLARGQLLRDGTDRSFRYCERGWRSGPSNRLFPALVPPPLPCEHEIVRVLVPAPPKAGHDGCWFGLLPVACDTAIE